MVVQAISQTNEWNMMCRKIWIRSIPAILAIPVLFCLPGLAAPDASLQQALIDSKALGNMGANVGTNGTTAVVSTYRVPGETDNKTKVKAILVARALMAKKKTLALVQCRFTDPAQKQSVFVIDIPAGTIAAFGSGTTSQETLLQSIRIQQYRDTDAQIESVNTDLGVVVKGNMEHTKRAAQLLAIQNLRLLKARYQPVLEEFKLEEKAAEVGDLTNYMTHFSMVNTMIDALNAEVHKQPTQSEGPIKPGDFYEQRTFIWRKMMDQKQAGKQTDAVEHDFDNIENYIGSEKYSKDMLNTMVQRLYTKVLSVH